MPLEARGRYYDPATEQFISRDPMEATSGQPYVYAGGNPVNLVDRTGAEPQLPIEPIEQSNGRWVQPSLPGFWDMLRGVGQAINGGGLEGGSLPEEVGMLQLRAAVESGQIRPINYKHRGGVYKFGPGTELAEKYPSGVEFTELGFPDFSPYARVSVRIRMTGTQRDTSEANRVAGPEVTGSFGAETWHHVEDRVTMQLVPYDLHWAVRHTGGEAIIDVLGALP